MTRADDNRIRIFDTTLRDGEQSPGASMTLDEKIRIAQHLEAMKVDTIEAGFAIASNGDFECVKTIAGLVRDSSICSLARAANADIDRAAEALKGGANPRIHTFIATSPLHMAVKLQMEPEAVLEAIHHSVSRARGYVPNVEWSAEDASRTEDDFLCQCVEAAIKAGATTINIPDTVGYAVPDEYGAQIAMLFERVPNIDQAIISTHCHNDLGLAVANSLMGVQNGARQIECTINGIGERAGNAALEEIVMAIKTRSDSFDFKTGVDATKITKASKTLSTITGFSVQPNKAIVGANAFAHASGIHQDGMLKHAQTYEIMTPESVGLTESKLVMAKHSGRAAFKSKLAELGYELGENAFQDAFTRFKDLADRKKEIYEDDLIALVEDEMIREHETMQFVSLQVEAGSQGPQIAELTAIVNDEEQAAKVEGNGPVDAIFKAIREIYPHPEAHLQLYQVHAVTGGTDAQATVSVRLEENGKTVNGQGSDADTLVASARAYMHALNKLLLKREQVNPQTAAQS